MRRIFWIGNLILLSVLVSGCASVGPDYTPPSIDAPEHWHTDLKDGLTPQPSDPAVLAGWWRTLDDPLLSALMARAVKGNLDLREARARVREARARRGISEAAFYPSVDATGSVSKGRSSENSGSGKESTLYSAGFDAGWELDVFGGTRRTVEAAQAGLEASDADLSDVLVSLLAEVARNYIDVRTYQARLRVAEANISAQEASLNLTQSRFEAGLSDELGVQQARYNLENTRALLPTLRTGLYAAQNRLSVLLGERPGSVVAELTPDHGIPVPPISVAVGIPADTLRRRPDIRRAERRLAAQTAQIGVATADLYPRFRLPGAIGLESLSADTWLNSSSLFWRIAPGVTWNIFDAGAVRQNIEVQGALQEQALARYEAALLTATEEVENALKAYAEEQLRRDALIAAIDAAGKSVQLSEAQYKAGLTDFSNVLIAQRSLLAFQDNLAVSEGTVTANLVRLYKALGGGWQPLAAENDRETSAP
ncbi:MAG: efflux transporter outer membrane subunit [Pseudomonadota bacterium]